MNHAEPARPAANSSQEAALAELRQVLDWEALLNQIPGGKAAVGEFAELMLQECPSLIAEILAALENNDARQLERSAHTLKGSARVFAARPLQEIAARVERLARGEEWDELGDATDELEQATSRFTTALRTAGETGLY